MQLSIAKICVATDFSPAAEHAVHYAAALAHQHQADLHLLHVLEHASTLVHHPDFSADGEVARAYFNRLSAEAHATDEATGEGEPEPQAFEWETQKPSTHQFLKSLEDHTREHLDSVRDDWWEGIEVIRSVRYGNPAEEICQYANRFGADVLVMGTHGKSLWQRMLLGSVTQRVLAHSPCPVMVIRHPDHQYTVVE